MDSPENIRHTVNTRKIVQVLNASFGTVADEFKFSAEKVPLFPAYATAESLDAKILQGLMMYGYYEKDKLLGCVGIRNTGEDRLFIIEYLAVLPECRHRNIGRYLVEHALEEICRYKGTVALIETVYENARLRKWFAALGFRERRVDTYPNLPFRVCIMTKNIPPAEEERRGVP